MACLHNMPRRNGHPGPSRARIASSPRVESIEIPPGVNVTSAAGALDAYNVPEPDGAAGAVVALGVLLARRRR